MIISILDKVYDFDFYDFFGVEYYELEMIENFLKYVVIFEKEKELFYIRFKIDVFIFEEVIKVIDYLRFN